MTTIPLDGVPRSLNYGLPGSRALQFAAVAFIEARLCFYTGRT
jgi:hypothetical protein